MVNIWEGRRGGGSHGRSSPQTVGGHGGPHLPPYLRPHLPSTPRLYPPRNRSSSPSKLPSFPPQNPPLLLQKCGGFGRLGRRRVWARTLVGVDGFGGRTMAEVGESQRQLDETPTWAVASVCAVIVLMSILLELVLHRVGEVYEGDSLMVFLLLDCFTTSIDLCVDLRIQQRTL